MRPLQLREVAVVSLVAVGALTAVGGVSGAAPRLAATASATTTRTTLYSPEAPVSTHPVDLGGTTAQAVTDGFGGGQSFAALPYPGEFIIVAPGLGRGLLGLPLPEYPLYVQASDLEPEQSIENGPYRLSASVSDDRVEGDARIDAADGASAASWATATIEQQPDGTVVATATSVTTGVTAGPLQLGTVRAIARVIQPPEGPAIRESEFTVEGATLEGLGVALRDGQLVLAGQAAVPLGVASDPLADVLASNGIVITYEPEMTDDGSVLSGGLTVTYTAQASLPSLPAGSTVTVQLGRAFAAVGAPAGLVRPSPPSGPASPIVTPPQDGGGAAQVAPPPTTPASIAPSAPPPPPVSPPTVPEPMVAAPAASTAAATLPTGGLWIYPIVVVATGALFCAVGLYRLAGLRGARIGVHHA